MMDEPQDAPQRSSPDPLAEARRLLHEQKKPAEALRLLEALLKQQPQNAPALAEQAAALADLSCPGPAAQAARRALEIDPSLDLPHAVLAAVAVRQGRLDLAESELRARLRALPADDVARRAAVFNQLGVLHYRCRRFSEAQEALGQALALTPDAPLLRYNLAMLHRRARRWEAAAAELERVLAAAEAPQDLAYLARVNLGHLHARAGRYSAARDQFSAALRLRRSALAWFYRAVPFLARFSPLSLLIVLLVILFVASYAVFIFAPR